MTFYRHFGLSKYSYVTNKKLVREFDKKIEKLEAIEIIKILEYLQKLRLVTTKQESQQYIKELIGALQNLK